MKKDKKDLKEMLQTMEPEQLFKWLSWILAGATSITVSVFIFYFVNFNDEFSSKQEVWGAFGDFVGGTLNPILSFMALIALLLTVVLQSKQLQFSNLELKETRKELKRSADAQENIQKAQIEQAKALQISAQISAVTKLLEQEDDTLKELIPRLSRYASATTIEEAGQNTEENKKKLRENLASLYQDLEGMRSL